MNSLNEFLKHNYETLLFDDEISSHKLILSNTMVRWEP